MKTALSLLLLSVSFFACAQETREPQNVITVTGNAQVFASPDEASVTIGVVEQASTAQEAQSKANAVIPKFISALSDLKIRKENIQTSRMALNPIYSQRPNEAQRISGYQAQDILTIRLTDFSLIGKVIDAGTTAGANNVEGINFQLRNSRGPRATAYKEAVADARSKADAIAEALGVKIAGVYDVRADNQGFAPQPMMMGRSLSAPSSTPVEPGQMEVGVTVTIRYRIG
jgi:uncharacterized protein